jgi:hypothetical protein
MGQDGSWPIVLSGHRATTKHGPAIGQWHVTVWQANPESQKLMKDPMTETVPTRLKIIVAILVVRIRMCDTGRRLIGDARLSIGDQTLDAGTKRE